MSTEEVLLERKGQAGVIILNRPEVHNALNLNMVQRIPIKLKQWESQVSLVIIKGSGERSFCIGGDILSVSRESLPEWQKAGGIILKISHLIRTYKIPFIALIHGITVGGGASLSLLGRYCVATEKTVFAMPETALGLIPMVGGSVFFPPLPNYLGTYLALTGNKLRGLDMFTFKLATHFCDFNKISSLEQDLLAITDTKQIPVILDEYTNNSLQRHNQGFSMTKHLQQTEKHFCHNTLEEIMQSLEKDNSEWSQKQLLTLKRMSPTAMKVTLRLIREGANMSFTNCMKMEYRVGIRISRGHDFNEVIRAYIEDKDNTPKWKPLEEVTDEYVQSFFDLLSINEEVKLKNKL